jgi:hypothetical protein
MTWTCSANNEQGDHAMLRAFIFLGGFSFAAFSQSSQTLTGTVSDSMCGAKHMMANLSAAQCTRECVKQGSDYALVVNGKVYTLKGDAKQIDQYAGQNVTVTGTVSGDTVTVKSISAAKS